MEQAVVFAIAQNALLTVLRIIVPLLCVGVCFKILVTIIDSASAVQETLVYSLKISLLLILISLLGPYLLILSVYLLSQLFLHIPF